MATECEFKPMECKFHLLGCSWKGIRRDVEEHESKCALSIKVDESLDIARDLHQKLMICQV